MHNLEKHENLGIIQIRPFNYDPRVKNQLWMSFTNQDGEGMQRTSDGRVVRQGV